MAKTFGQLLVLGIIGSILMSGAIDVELAGRIVITKGVRMIQIAFDPRVGLEKK